MLRAYLCVRREEKGVGDREVGSANVSNLNRRITAFKALPAAPLSKY